MSSSSDSDEGKERYTYVIGRTDSQAWEDDLVPYLRRRYQADEGRQKMDIITSKDQGGAQGRDPQQQV